MVDVYRQALIDGGLTDGLVPVCLVRALEAFRTGERTNSNRHCVRIAMQELVEAEATTAIGASRYERTESRVTEQNGLVPRVLTITAGQREPAVLGCA